MIIQNNTNNINFKGYDARKIKGFVMNSNFAGIADEMKNIGEIEKFKVFLFENLPAGISLKNDCFQRTQHSKGCWAQDNWGIVKDTLFSYENSLKSEMLNKAFKLKASNLQSQIRKEMNIDQVHEYVDLLYNLPVIEKDGKKVVELITPDGTEYIDKNILDKEFQINSKILKNLLNQTHVKGGNYFITKNKNGEDELLIGEHELRKFNIPLLQEMFKTKNIHIIPQADFHIDLFLRPLKDKKVLIADDNMMLETLSQGIENIKKAIFKTPPSEIEKFKIPFVKTSLYLEQFKQIIAKNPYQKMQDVEQVLLKAGYEPIKTPSRIFEIFADVNDKKVDINGFYLKQLHNYMNANVLVNDKNEIIYITNKSNLDDVLGLTEEIQKETNFSLEKAFLDKVKPHVDKVYFVSGEDNTIAKTLLPEQNGGIHCMCMEIPE